MKNRARPGTIPIERSGKIRNENNEKRIRKDEGKL
jgi:hypothetical protein